jgi:methionyl-tRNA formyltransferase
MKDLRIVFMGTPEFAVAALGSLLMNGYNVAGVVTAPDKPAGRGRVMSKSAVREFAESSHLPVMQPTNLKDPEFIERLTNLRPDLIIVVAFRMLPEAVWRIPSIGTFNLHASLLPDYRGAAPINHVLINGETLTGVTTFLIDDKIDTGSILLREEVSIYPFDTAGDLHDRLMKIGARLTVRTVEGLRNGTISPKPQSLYVKPGSLLKPAPKIFPEDCIIDWKSRAVNINNLIRGLSPYPGAKAYFMKESSGISFKIFESHPETVNHDLAPGSILSDGKKDLKIACSDGFINVLSLQLEGKKRMGPAEFLRGFRLSGFTVSVS